MIRALRRLFTPTADTPASEPVAPATQATPADPALLPILSSDALLQPYAKTIELIQRQVGIPLAHWNALYDQLFHNFAFFVQQLPASEAHHHRQAGGLLAHSLDATLQALRIRRGVLLPTGASAEQIADKQDVWTYAVVTSALLHDLGKPVVDQTVHLFNLQGDSLGLWHPLSGAMAPLAASYKLSYVRGRRYRLHPLVPPLLVQHIVPGVGLHWLAQDIDAFEAWLATITGGNSEFSGKLGQIIGHADRLSVASDIAGASSAATLDTAPSHSFAERLAIALRQLIDGQTLPLNRAGAAGWVVGDDLWLVSKRALDALREQLSKDSAGASAPRNERLMDELQQHGIVMANGDRAIWKATIELAGWRQSFTLLRVPLNRLWIDPASRPPPVEGRVAIDGASPSPDVANATPTAVHEMPLGEMRSEVAASASPDDLYGDLPLPPLVDISSTSEAAAEKGASVHAEQTPASVTTIKQRPSEIETIALTPVVRPTEPAPSSEEDLPVADRDFFDWVRDGIAAGRLNVNTRQARLHVTNEGLLLVSPGIFRDFAGNEGWTKAQKTVQRRELHRRKPDGTNIWTYRVVGERRSGARLKGLLIPDPEKRLGLKLPSPNPHLCLLDLDRAPRPGAYKAASTDSPE